MPKRVMIDTDPGIDDALALLLALNCPELEVMAITTVCGNVPVQTATHNVLRLLALAAPDRQPVLSQGAAEPLHRLAQHAPHIHAEDGLGGAGSVLDTLAYPGAVPLSEQSAAEEMVSQLRASAKPVTLITLGPLTNLALALQLDPATLSQVQEVIVMGGAITCAGNITAAAEFNMYADPHAASLVLAAGLPLTLVGLDVTRQVRLTLEMLKTACAGSDTVRCRFLTACCQWLQAVVLDLEGENGIPLHDPLAVGVAVDPGLVHTEPFHVQVETQGRYTLGMTLADQRPLKAQHKMAPNVDVCRQVRVQDFMDLFLSRTVQESR